MPSTNPWGVPDCGRADCVPCSQSDETRIDCKKRNIMYENRCELCCKKDGKGNKICQEDGKGTYVGESSRSIYKRAKEHQADRENRTEDSHQIKHWLLDHQELLAPPKFNFKIIKSFQDPLSRQLSEAVRIELRGETILNSKSEFNRCKVPRLKINMEEWKSKKEKEEESRKPQPENEVSNQEEATQPEQPSSQWEEADWLLEAESSLSLLELKRKREKSPMKKQGNKKRKLEKLVSWGEHSSLEEDQDHLAKGTSPQEENSETLKQGHKMSSLEEHIRKEAQSMPVRKPDSSKQTSLLDWRMETATGKSGSNKSKEPEGKTKTNKKNRKLTKKEMKDVKLTHSNIFDWLKPPKMPTITEIRIKKQDAQIEQLLKEAEPMEVVDMDREERLDRVQKRQIRWASSQLCKSLVVDLVGGAVKESVEKMCKDVLLKEVVDKAWGEIEFEYIMEMMDRGDIGLRGRIEKRLTEDRELLEAEEAARRQMELDTIRKKKSEALKTLWRKRRMEMDIKRMTDALDRLQISDWDRELDQLMDILDKMILEVPTINTEDVIMTDKVEANHLPDILWRDEGMDTGTGLVTGMAMEDGDEEASDTEKVESMVGVTSLYLEESHHHGGLLPSVHVETTISENGMESGYILDGQCTVDLGTGARTPARGRDMTHNTETGQAYRTDVGPGSDNIWAEHTLIVGPETNLMQPLAGNVQSEHTVKNIADLRKVSEYPNSTNFDKSPSMVNGMKEGFKDVRSMVGVWEDMDGDEGEWLQVGERRRGGRRISRRISELIMNFQEEGGPETDRKEMMEQNLDGYCITLNNDTQEVSRMWAGCGGLLGVQDTVSNTNANVKTIFSECGCDIQLVRNGTSSRKSADCDWLKARQLSTNRRGDKRMRESESMIMFPETKKMGTGSPLI